jgi:hypothetical protein
MTSDDQGQFDPGFRIVDKRRAGAEQSEEPKEGAVPPEPPAPSPAARAASPGDDREPPASAQAGPEQPSEAGEGEVPLEPVDVFGVVEYCISVLNAHAWQAMGLVINPLTKRADRDLPQAQIAIDCVESLLRRVEAQMPADRSRKLRQVLADLQVNFVHQSQRRP